MEFRHKLVLLRHGESDFTRDDRFCGFGNDADLTQLGHKEASSAGQRIFNAGLQFDVAFTSVLKRAVKTLFLVQEELDCHWLPVVKTWRLNERHYGALQGLSKTETVEKYGEDQVKLWRRSYETRPPPVDEKEHLRLRNTGPYRDLNPSVIPICESLKDTVERMIPAWHDEIAPMVKAGQRVLIVAHGNSIRGLMKYIKRLSDEDIIKLEIAHGLPLVVELDEELLYLKDYYLASDAEVYLAMNKSWANKSGIKLHKVDNLDKIK